MADAAAIPEPGTTCPLCGSPPSDPSFLSGPDRLHDAPGTFRVALCSGCGAGWTLPVASDQELAAFYPGSYCAHGRVPGLVGVVQRVGKRLILDRALRRPPFAAVAAATPGDLLDVGCGRGDVGVAFRRRGWRVAGVDPSAEACAVARGSGIDAHAGTLESAPWAAESFDAAVLNHSLEHVPDPLGDLERVSRLLRPGGLLAISVPNFASWQRERYGSTWFHLELPRHRTHFTPASLGLALERAGLDVVSMRPTSDAGCLLASWQYARFGHLVLADGLHAWAGYALSILISPLNRLLDRFRGQGALLHAVARRPA
jgi:SAM-dependent methyltransferase